MRIKREGGERERQSDLIGLLTWFPPFPPTSSPPHVSMRAIAIGVLTTHDVLEHMARSHLTRRCEVNALDDARDAESEFAILALRRVCRAVRRVACLLDVLVLRAPLRTRLDQGGLWPVYTLAPHAWNCTQAYVDDDGALGEHTVAPRPPFAWRISIVHPSGTIETASEGHPIDALWCGAFLGHLWMPALLKNYRCHTQRLVDKHYGRQARIGRGAFLWRYNPRGRTMKQHIQVMTSYFAAYFVSQHDGSTSEYDQELWLIDCLYMTLFELLMHIYSLAPFLCRLRAAANRYTAWTHARGAARLGCKVTPRTRAARAPRRTAGPRCGP